MIYQSITITNKHTVLFNFIVLFEVETQNNKRQKKHCGMAPHINPAEPVTAKTIRKQQRKTKQSVVTMATIQVGNLRSY